MKFFAFIMAIIVLIQSGMPCKEDLFAMKAVKAKTEISKSSQQNDRDHSDACSPFCQCSCCAGFSINHTFASVVTLKVFNKRAFTSYLSTGIIEISLPVWQPPQLVV